MLWALAIDHRSSFRTQFLGLRGSPSPEQEAQMRWAKTLAFEALLSAVTRGLPTGRPGLLIDEEYGADLIARAKAAGVTVIVPAERSGQDELAFEHGDDGFGAAVERSDPTYVKLLVRYNPVDDRQRNARQRERLTHLQAWLDANGRDWMLELLVPPSQAEQGRHGFDPDRWDVEQRPRLTVDAIAELAASGLRPAYWKLEGMPSTAACEAVAEATQATGRSDAACLVLGRGADSGSVDNWLQRAAPVAAYQGFAIGRTLWWQPLRDALTGACSVDAAADRIASNYLRGIDVYLAALRDGARVVHSADRVGLEFG